jgi:hypothetical protein
MMRSDVDPTCYAISFDSIAPTVTTPEDDIA